MTTTRTTLTIEPLTAEAFRPFGDVIEARDTAHHFTINQGFAERYHDLAHIDTAGEGGHAIVSLFKALPRDFPMAIEEMERHPLGSQAFVALAPAPFLVVVAPPGAAPGPEDLRCFLAQAGQGVNYARGTWHHPLIALDAPGDFLVIDRGGPAPHGESSSVNRKTRFSDIVSVQAENMVEHVHSTSPSDSGAPAGSEPSSKRRSAATVFASDSSWMISSAPGRSSGA